MALNTRRAYKSGRFEGGRAFSNSLPRKRSLQSAHSRFRLPNNKKNPGMGPGLGSLRRPSGTWCAHSLFAPPRYGADCDVSLSEAIKRP